MKFYYDYSFRPDSSTIKEVFYDHLNKTLAIEFNHGGFAGYTNVTIGIYNGLAGAESAGKYYNRYVRGAYTGARVDSVEKKQKDYVPLPTAENRDRGVPDLPNFKIVAEVTGGVTIEVRAADIADALRVAEEQINKAFEGDVTVNFKGVNVV